MIDPDRALRAFTDVLAVEYREDEGMMRVVTMGEAYTVDVRDGLHQCPDREYHDVDYCKHVVAADLTRGRIDAPTGWLTVEDLDDRPEPLALADGGPFDEWDNLSYGEEIEYVGPTDLPGDWVAPQDWKQPYTFQHVSMGGVLSCLTKYNEQKRIPSDHPINDPAHWKRADAPELRADGGQIQQTEQWVVVDHDNDNKRTADSRSEAEKMADTAREFGSDNVDIIPPGSTEEPPTEPCAECGDPVSIAEARSGREGRPVHEECFNGAEVVNAEPVEPAPEPDPDTPAEAADLPERSVADDPLDILPSYMIDVVQGTPALNKRGLSVLAFEYGVDVVDREYHALPTETDWESAIVETTVTNEDGKTFVGTGSAHVDRGDDKEVLLELAETRSYKRAVSFATGTGIVAYQELTNEVE